MPDSSAPQGGAEKGVALEKKFRELQENWVKMPEAERAKAIQSLTREYPPTYRPIIEQYFKTLNRNLEERDR